MCPALFGDAEGSGSPAGRQGGSWPPFSLLHTLRPDLPVSQEEMRPVPVPSQVSRAQLELQVIGSCRAPYSSLRTGAGSAAFTCPIKHCSLPMQCMAPSGDLSLPGQRGRVSSLRNQSPKLIKSLEMPWGVCALKDNYRVTQLPRRLVGGEQIPLDCGPELICPHRAGHCVNEPLEPIIPLRLQSSPRGWTVLLSHFTDIETEPRSGELY